MSDDAYIHLFGEPIEVDWAAHGTEWVDRLREEIADLAGAPQWRGTPVQQLEGGAAAWYFARTSSSQTESRLD